MEIVMIKKDGCGPCKMFEPTAKRLRRNNLSMRNVNQKDLPENL